MLPPHSRHFVEMYIVFSRTEIQQCCSHNQHFSLPVLITVFHLIKAAQCRLQLVKGGLDRKQYEGTSGTTQSQRPKNSLSSPNSRPFFESYSDSSVQSACSLFMAHMYCIKNSLVMVWASSWYNTHSRWSLLQITTIKIETKIQECQDKVMTGKVSKKTQITFYCILQ